MSKEDRVCWDFGDTCTSFTHMLSFYSLLIIAHKNDLEKKKSQLNITRRTCTIALQSTGIVLIRNLRILQKFVYFHTIVTVDS